MEDKLTENNRRRTERIALYKSFGYDIEKERNLIFERARPIHGDILEVGTGKGYFTVELAKKGYKLTSIDVSCEEQEYARLSVKHLGLEERVDFKIEDAGKMSFADCSFNIIFAIHALHHFKEPFKVMDELIRVLRPNGRIILSDFTAKGFEIIDKVHQAENRSHDEGGITLPEIELYLINKGFKTHVHRSRFQEILIASPQQE